MRCRPGWRSLATTWERSAWLLCSPGPSRPRLVSPLELPSLQRVSALTWPQYRRRYDRVQQGADLMGAIYAGRSRLSRGCSSSRPSTIETVAAKAHAGTDGTAAICSAVRRLRLGIGRRLQRRRRRRLRRRIGRRRRLGGGGGLRRATGYDAPHAFSNRRSQGPRPFFFFWPHPPARRPLNARPRKTITPATNCSRPTPRSSASSTK